ncbi:MAG: tyrosine-protein phosphatase [Mycobacteriales bacterium]
MSVDRWLDLEGAVNVRDLGGLATADGRTTMPRVLLRSDNLQGLTEKDVAHLLGEVGLRTVLDLRTPAEVEGEGPGPLVAAGLRHVNLNFIPGWDPRAYDGNRVIPHEKRYDNDMSHFYLGYLDEAGAEVARAMHALAEPECGTAVVHCAAGKDRTGVLCALALVVAGVSRDDIVADYALTAERIEAIRDRLTNSPTYADDMTRRSLDDMRPHPESMGHFLDRLDERGGVQAWLTETGFGPDHQAALRDRLVG